MKFRVTWTAANFLTSWAKSFPGENLLQETVSFRDLFILRFSFVELRGFVCMWLNKAAQEAKNFTNEVRHIVLLLINLHAMKPYGEMPVYLRHRSRWIISLTPSPLYPRGNSRNQEGVIIANNERYPMHTRNKLGRPQNRLISRFRQKYLSRPCLPVKGHRAVNDLRSIKWNSKLKN